MPIGQWVRWAFVVIVALVSLYVAARIVWWLVRSIRLILRGIAEERALSRLRDTHDLERRIDRMAAEYVAGHSHARLVIGVVQGDRRSIRGFGSTNVPANFADDQLIYEIGSITKVFTGILLARLELDGLVGLDDPISSLLPADTQPRTEVAAVTLRQLATHTSGLPRLPDNLDTHVTDEADPYRRYGAEQLLTAVKRCRLERKPGEKSEYSNFGVGLLGFLLARRAGEPYDRLVRRCICEPLGLSDTVVDLNEDQRPRFVPGRTPAGQPTSPWHFDALAGAGAFRSKVKDMLNFLAANFEPDGSDLGRSLNRALNIHRKSFWGSHQGLGWAVEKDGGQKSPIHWHNGGTGGFVSFAAMMREHRVGVVLLANSGDGMSGDDSLDRIGFRLTKTAAKVSLGSSTASL